MLTLKNTSKNTVIPGKVHHFRDERNPSHKRFTILVRWAGRGLKNNEWEEEIDIDANNEKEAKKIARKELVENYTKGKTFIKAVERFGLYM